MAGTRIIFGLIFLRVDPSGNTLRRKEYLFLFLGVSVKIGQSELLKEGDYMA